MAAELAGGCELTELVAYHVLGYIHRNELVTVVHCNGVAHEVGADHLAQVFTTTFLPLSFMASTFFSRLTAMKGPFLSERLIVL